MSATLLDDMPSRETVGVRELRQRASELLGYVEAGWTVTITRNGRPVARLVPATPPGDPLDLMVSTGAALRAEDMADLLDVVPVSPAAGELPGAALARLREEERW
jgi:prevent-host-death family protein